MYKNREDRLRWAREKYANDFHTRELAKIRARRNRLKNKKRYKTTHQYKYKRVILVRGSVQYKKKQCRDYVHYMIRSKQIMRLPCEVCGNIDSQAHHSDYSKPLEIIWLCSVHHGEKHRKN